MTDSELDLDSTLALDLNAKRELIVQWNDAYRTGEALVPDLFYDTVLESLPEDDELRQKVGFEVSDQRKTELPLPMFSMDKVKSYDEIKKWMESKKIDDASFVIVTPKYDGLSFLLQPSTGKAYTRGNGKVGQRSDEHFAILSSNKSFSDVASLEDRHLIGEVIMPRATFSEKYAETYRNPRNLVAGLFNQKDPDQMLKDVEFIAYGIGEERESKSEALDIVQSFNTVELPLMRIQLKDLNDDLLTETFEKWNLDFEIDGLILELEDQSLRRQLGREKNSNPAYSRAWKGFQAQSAETEIQDISYQVSKDGRLAAVGHVSPITLDGVTVSNVTLYNAGMMEEKGWGIGAKVKIIRSGMVIPKIVETLSPIVPDLPSCCPSCDHDVNWDENHIHLTCHNKEACRAILIQSNISFFKVMDIEEVGDKLVEQLFDAGYKTIESILKMSQSDFLNLDRFAEKKALLIHESIHSKLIDVPLEKVQHASGCFFGLGTKKLALLTAYRDRDQAPKLEELSEVDGYSEISAKAYLEGINNFWTFLDALPITIEPYKEVARADGVFNDTRFCFTGFRDKELEKVLEGAGAKMVSGVNGKTTHLVAKSIEGNSSKLKKARDLGIELWDRDRLLQTLKEHQLVN